MITRGLRTVYGKEDQGRIGGKTSLCSLAQPWEGPLCLSGSWSTVEDTPDESESKWGQLCLKELQELTGTSSGQTNISV